MIFLICGACQNYQKLKGGFLPILIGYNLMILIYCTGQRSRISARHASRVPLQVLLEDLDD
ncbi:uncharacterized protein Bfra_004315 [Botrytis fragariae]|uniref:Uncharacterized protein n=1 Tax=Botrytis fragariae TaxID=1964551 RepID=A0A8H6AVK7_9HELO|nr:uncharacterized protein Bfra_004315 [Botrytis fragariae]KAF5874309.1 hypothetical protein Bfra_004315 [Botrytis fragariae]